MNNENDIKAARWLCPLLKKEINEGTCLDINYQRLELFKKDILKDIMKEKRYTLSDVNNTCENCPNLPL
ncbi:MAG: hypothetical protein IPP74_04915 [Alphaproteobacteria bacterium]|nr:hypothetical protein [Alphaproteobacteria bacterium]